MISNTDEVIDSRDVIARIAELEATREALVNEIAGFSSDVVEDAEDDADRDQQLATRAADKTLAEEALEEFDSGDEGIELHHLKELADDASGSPDWMHGATLINDDYFEDYARELADDIGAVKSDAGWPTMHIDWEAAAKSLQQDYTQVDFDGQTFWVRA